MHRTQDTIFKPRLLGHNFCGAIFDTQKQFLTLLFVVLNFIGNGELVLRLFCILLHWLPNSNQDHIPKHYANFFNIHQILFVVGY